MASSKKKSSKKEAATGTPVSSGIKKDIKGIFQDRGQQTSGASAYSLGQQLVPGDQREANLNNYTLPGAASANAEQGFLTNLADKASNPQNIISPELQNAVALLQQNAGRQEFAGPELLQAFNAARGLATNGSDPVAIAQRESMNAGLNRGLQTAMRGAATSGMNRGLVGGASNALYRPILRDYLATQQQGQRDLQLGNLQNYFGLANQVDQNRENTRANAIGQFNSGAGQMNSFYEGAMQNRFGAYGNQMNDTINRYYSLKGQDANRRDSYSAFDIGNIYSGANVNAGNTAANRAYQLGNKSIEAQGGSVPPFGLPVNQGEQIPRNA